MTIPDEMFNSLRNARHFMLALMDPKQTPKVPKEIRKRARDRLKHFPSEYDIDQLEQMHANMQNNPNIVFNDCMKRLESVRGELILAERKVANITTEIIQAIQDNRGA